jgi:hypothetical protein
MVVPWSYGSFRLHDGLGCRAAAMDEYFWSFENRGELNLR